MIIKYEKLENTGGNCMVLFSTVQYGGDLSVIAFNEEYIVGYTKYVLSSGIGA